MKITKRTFKPFLLLPLFVFISCYPLKYTAKNINTSSFYPFIIENIKTVCVDTTYKVVGYIKSYPEKPILKKDSLVFRVQFRIRFYPDTLCWQEPFFAILDYSPKKTKIVEFNAQNAVLCNNSFLDFNFNFMTKFNHKNKIRMTLAYIKNGVMITDRSNPFRSRIL